MATTARQVLALTLLILLAASPSAHADDYVSMPSAKADAKNLKLRFVEYDGSTNGEMVIEVKNFGKKNATFVSDGLFFVPKGDPEKAPQRLGAAGPFTEIAKGRSISHQDKTVLKAGETKTLRLDVFCIDSHRSSPSKSTKFAIAKNKLPKELRRELRVSNKAILKANQGDRRKSKSAIQGNMWKTRDKKWIKIEGERAVEKAPPASKRHRNAPNRRTPLRKRRNQ